MEIFDIVDNNGIPTGETVERPVAHTDGVRHRTSHIWVIRRVEGRVQILLQKRSEIKDSFPGRYDTSSAGHIHAGDEPLYSAIRELEEELGISANEDELEFAGTFDVDYIKTFHGSPFHDVETAFVFIYQKPVDIEGLVLQEEEVDEVEWFDLEETYTEMKAHNKKFCIPMEGLETLISWLNK